MAGSVNKAIIVGNLGKDPEIRRTQDGRQIASLTVATSETWRDKSSGDRKEKTEWHKVVIFNEGLCKVAEKYLRKGSKVYIEGQIQTRKWIDKDGGDRYSTEIILQGFSSVLTMLDGPAKDNMEQETSRTISQQAQAKVRKPDPISTGKRSIIPDDDMDGDAIPF